MTPTTTINSTRENAVFGDAGKDMGSRVRRLLPLVMTVSLQIGYGKLEVTIPIFAGFASKKVRDSE
jgi:hypothetical protein